MLDVCLCDTIFHLLHVRLNRAAMILFVLFGATTANSIFQTIVFIVFGFRCYWNQFLQIYFVFEFCSLCGRGRAGALRGLIMETNQKLQTAFGKRKHCMTYQQQMMMMIVFWSEKTSAIVFYLFAFGLAIWWIESKP